MKLKSLLFSIILFSILSVHSQTDKEEYKEAVIYFKQANEFKQKYDFENALIYFNKAAVLFKKNNYTGNYIQSKYSVADIYIQNKNKNRADIIIKDLENISIEKYGEDNKFLTNIYYAKGRIAALNSKHNKAITIYQKSAVLNDKHDKPNSFFKSNLHTSIGNSYFELGKINLALYNYKKDIEIKKTYVGETHPMLAIGYNNISGIYKTKGQFDLALKYIDKALDLNINAYGNNNPLTADFYNSKGNIYSEMGQYDLALEFFRTSLNINKALFGNKNIAIAKNLNDIGIIYNRQKKYNEALIFFKDAYDIQIDILGTEHPDIAGTCNNIGYILEYQGKHETSLKYYQNAIAIKSKTFGNNHPELAVYYNNIGINYYNTKNYSKALENYLNAILILENNYGNKFAGIIPMYLNMADLYRKEDNFNKSLEYYQKSIAANVIDFNLDTTNYYSNPIIHNYLDIHRLLYSLQGKAGALDAIYKKGSQISDLEFAKNTYILCDSVISIARKQAIKQSDKINLGNQTKAIYQSAVTVFSQLADNTEKEKQKKKYYENMFYFSEKNKALILSQSVISSDVKSFADVPIEIIDNEKKIKNEISETEKLLIESSNKKNTKKYRERLFILNEELRKFNSELEKNYPKYYNSKYKDIELDIKEIQSYLDDNAAVRSYFSGDDVFIIFTITKNDIKVYSIEKPEDFEKKVKDFNKYITSGYKSYFKLYLKSANEFYNLLFPNDLPKEIKKLTIIPDGLIGIIPFEALITEKYTGDITDYKSYPFLIKKYQINYSYSAGLLLKTLKNKRGKDNRKSWIGIAPVFDNIEKLKINNVSVTPLLGSKKEIQNIAQIFINNGNEVDTVLEENATETYIKNENLKNYKYIHIATHGIVNTDNPNLSGVLLYPENNNNDGILYSGEIYNLELDADLTVLSACETGLGKISKSEGIIGLSRALLYAGSDNTIVSLWKVSDVSTSNLMFDFYTNLIENEEDRANALHKAKMKMIETGENFAHPFFWSPFVLIGK